LSRCVVTLDAGVRMSWAEGSLEAGAARHQRDEASFRERIDLGTPGIEGCFDALERAGHSFLAPTHPDFHARAQRSSRVGLPTVELEVACTPALEEAALAELTEQVAALLRAPAPAPSPTWVVPRRPWWRFW
jgi:hypothetical protein